MANTLVINAAGQETRVALVENNSITEFYLERKREKGIVGNIYKGRVARVLPGMQAAFVDIGLDKAAFLYVADVAGVPNFAEEFELAEAPEGEHGEAADLAEPTTEEEVKASEATAAAPAPTPTTEPVTEVAAAETGATESASESIAETPDEDEEVFDEEDDEEGDEQSEADLAHEAAQAGTEAAPTEPATQPADLATHPPVPAESSGIVSVTTTEPEPTPSTAAPQDPAVVTSGTAVVVTSPEGVSITSGTPAGPTTLPMRPLQKGGRGRRRGRGRHGRSEARGAAYSGQERQAKPREESHQSATGSRPQIQDLLKEGDDVVVQVVKDPIGTKGARVTCHISLPGRHLVFMPTVDHVGISRRIEAEKERRRLRGIVDELRPAGSGFIVRTVAENVEQEKLTADIKFLISLWNDIARRKDTIRAPKLLHPDLDLILRSVRDLFSAEVSKLVIDDRAEYERILEFVTTNVPQLKDAVELYTGADPIFDEYGIEQELTRSLSRKVWLKSGGYLIIDQAEALTAIDVNSGRYVGKKNLEETITKINVEAAREVVYQLRLRNIGGIIIIDFIDMDKGSNRDKVFRALQEACEHDRAKTNVLKISDLGLVEMTRKRVRESVGRLLYQACPNCDGKGLVKSKITVSNDIMRDIQRNSVRHREDLLVVNCHPDVARLLTVDEKEALRELMMRFNKTIQVRPQSQYHQEQYDLAARWSKEDRGRRGGGTTQAPPTEDAKAET